MSLKIGFPKTSLSGLDLMLALLTVFSKIMMIMNKKALLKMILNVAKYIVTLALGYLGGSSDIL